MHNRLVAIWKQLRAIVAAFMAIWKRGGRDHTDLAEAVVEAIHCGVMLNPAAYFIHVYKVRVRDDGNGYVGLNASADMTVNELCARGARASAIGVADDNAIDAVLFNERPSHMIIKAFWVRIEKLEALAMRYPSCQFIVCCHSRASFLASEARGFERLAQIGRLSQRIPTVRLAANNIEMVHFINDVMRLPCIYLPNLVPLTPGLPTPKPLLDLTARPLRVGLFCAVRPLKNMPVQAAAALSYCVKRGCALELYTMSGRYEMGGRAVIAAVREIFACAGEPHRLIEYPWMDHIDFSALVREMDVGMQASYTESHNLVACDFINAGVPVVASPTITWVPKSWVARDPDSITCVTAALARCVSWVECGNMQFVYDGRDAIDDRNDAGWDAYLELAAGARRW